MFKKFTRDDISSRSNIKSSVQRSLRTRFVDQFPNIEEHIDEVVPKKSQLTQVKCQDRLSLYTADGELVFLQQHDDDLIPSLRLVHKLPKDTFPWVRVDRGAIKFILGGANIMCPGLTSAGAEMPVSYEKGQLVVIYAEGKEHALAIGRLEMSTDDITKLNKGIGVTVILFLGDGIWNLGPQI